MLSDNQPLFPCDDAYQLLLKQTPEAQRGGRTCGRVFTRSQVFSETRNNADGFSLAKYNRYAMGAVCYFLRDPFALGKEHLQCRRGWLRTPGCSQRGWIVAVPLVLAAGPAWWLPEEPQRCTGALGQSCVSEEHGSALKEEGGGDGNPLVPCKILVNLSLEALGLVYMIVVPVELS